MQDSQSLDFTNGR